jgi:C1A family cysteine protease
MKAIFLLSLVSFVISSDLSVFDRFREWIKLHNIEIYNNNHMSHVFSNWVDNDNFIEFKNSLGLSYKLGHNEYSGLNSEEFGELMGFNYNKKVFELHNHNQTVYKSLKVALPTSVDWRNQNAVNDIKNQGQCGSCWAFSTVASVEGALAIKSGKLYSLSEQQLVDCSKTNLGCNGGLPDRAFKYYEVNDACTEDSYPYTSGVTKTGGTCQTSCNYVSLAHVKSYVDITPNSDNAMVTAIAQQPVSIGIEADQRSFQLYTSGIFDDPKCGTNIDHAVNLVGYTNDYFILRNSWGTSWGNKGYMYIARNAGQNVNGVCGLYMMGSYPVL